MLATVGWLRFICRARCVCRPRQIRIRDRRSFPGIFTEIQLRCYKIEPLTWVIQCVLVDFHRFVVATDKATSELLPVSSALPVLRGSDRWTHAHDLLGLVSFTHRSVPKTQCVVVSISISFLFTTWSYSTSFLSTHQCQEYCTLHGNYEHSAHQSWRVRGLFCLQWVGAYEWNGELM